MFFVFSIRDAHLLVPMLVSSKPRTHLDSNPNSVERGKQVAESTRFGVASSSAGFCCKGSASSTCLSLKCKSMLLAGSISDFPCNFMRFVAVHVVFVSRADATDVPLRELPLKQSKSLCDRRSSLSSFKPCISSKKLTHPHGSSTFGQESCASIF